MIQWISKVLLKKKYQRLNTTKKFELNKAQLQKEKENIKLEKQHIQKYLAYLENKISQVNAKKRHRRPLKAKQ